MCPRPRLASDDDILQATARAIGRLGPARLTLADVAREAGLSPAALVQRFGSKRGLLLALASTAGNAVADEFARLRATSASPLAAVRAWAECMACMAESPEALSHHLAFLQMDLTDPEFHRHALAHSLATRAELQALAGQALRAGELRGCTAAAVARAWQVVVNGSLLTWAIHRQGTAGAWVRQDLDAALRPFEAAPPGPRREKAPRRRASLRSSAHARSTR